MAVRKRGERAMKRKRSTITGVLCGVLCALCVGIYTMQVDEQAAAVRAEALERYGGEQIEVCVAKRDIAPGETLTEGAIETKMWVAALLPEGVVTDRGEAVGKVAGTSVLKGEVILSKRFDARTASLEVPQGFTAVSVPTRDVQAVGGALAAGMRTDVYAMGASSAERILTRASVLATSATDAAGTASGSITWVTLAVAPEKVQEVIAAAENLQLYFVLPAQTGEDDDEEEAIDPETLRSRVLEGASSASGSAAVGSGASDASAGTASVTTDVAAQDAAAPSEGANSADDEREEGTSWIR